MPVSILVLDDEREILDIYTPLTERYSRREVYPAAKSYEAIDIIEKHKPQILVVDYTLIGDTLNGVEVFQKAKEIIKDPVGIMVTGNLDDKVKDESKEAGINIILEKPLDFAEYETVLKKTIQELENSPHPR